MSDFSQYNCLHSPLEGALSLFKMDIIKGLTYYGITFLCCTLRFHSHGIHKISQKEEL